MNADEAQQLLGYIQATDRRPFPAGAALVWADLLATVSLRDAHQAVREHFLANDKAPTVAEIRSRVGEIVRVREAANRRALERDTGPVQLTERGRQARAEVMRLAARLSMDRATRPRTTKPDLHQPIDPESEITEERRAAALRALSALRVA